MKPLFATLLALLLLHGGQAHAQECTIEDQYAFEKIAGTYLDSWNNVYIFYKDFRQCLDGSANEGLPDSIVRLFIQDWPKVVELQSIISQDDKFGRFIVSNITMLAGPEDTDHLRKLATKSCSAKTKTICSKIIEQIKELDAEVEKEKDNR